MNTAHYPHRTPEDGVAEQIRRMLCFAHAGASAMTYASWRSALSGQLELRPIDLPGRVPDGPLPPTTMAAALEAVREQVAGEQRPGCVLYGHSLGSLMAFEAARMLSAQGNPPAMLIVSGRNGPTRKSPYPVIHGLPDEHLLTAVLDMDESMPALRDYPDLARILLPVLRSDLTIAETYEYRSSASLLPCPILSIQGQQDVLVTRPGVAAWSAETSATCKTVWLPGGHFFHLTRPEFLRQLPQAISTLLA
jgi:pyochelin biosynthetic protein PchC